MEAVWGMRCLAHSEWPNLLLLKSAALTPGYPVALASPMCPFCLDGPFPAASKRQVISVLGPSGPMGFRFALSMWFFREKGDV